MKVMRLDKAKSVERVLGESAEMIWRRFGDDLEMQGN